MKFKDTFEYELMPNLNTVIMHTKKCEGKHVQQVVYSTYHSGLTQICFGCKKIRTTIEIEDQNCKEDELNSPLSSQDSKLPEGRNPTENIRTNEDTNHLKSEAILLERDKNDDSIPEQQDTVEEQSRHELQKDYPQCDSCKSHNLKLFPDNQFRCLDCKTQGKFTLPREGEQNGE